MIIPISEDCRRCKQKHGLLKLYVEKDEVKGDKV